MSPSSLWAKSIAAKNQHEAGSKYTAFTELHGVISQKIELFKTICENVKSYISSEKFTVLQQCESLSIYFLLGEIARVYEACIIPS
jgi:hypothetical protein